jgi:hypothetical protein
MKNKEWFPVEEDINQIERDKVSLDAKRLVKELPSAFQEDFNIEREESVSEKELSKEAEALIALRWSNLFNSLKEHGHIQNDIAFKEMGIRIMNKKMREQDKRTVFTRNEVTDKWSSDISDLEQQKKNLEQQTPEAYVGIKLADFKEQIKRVKDGLLVETKYVQSRKKETLKDMENGNHVFLHGHLGGGKSEFAVQTSIERMIRLNVDNEIDNWIKDNPQASKEDIIARYKKINRDYRSRLKKNDPDLMEKVMPLVISGSKDFSLQDLYTEKSLKLTKFNGKDLSEHHKSIDDAYKKWYSENEAKLSELSDEEKLEAERKAADDIRNIYMIKNQGFGTEVEKIDKELKKAIKEGKPIIIDEANAIPPTLLISMNDILTKKAGQMAYIPGEGPVEIKEGFSIIMTGNLQTGNLAEYFGTEEMNPAFLSRLKVKEYDYLPQNESGNLNEQKEPEKNELFQVLVALLSEKNGGLQLPEGSLEKIFHLAQFASVTQKVFSGRWEESEMGPGGVGIEPELKKSVLSTRNLINILIEWNKGQEMDLDTALWKGFISNATVPEDQKFLLNEARKYNFFNESGGWDIDSLKEGKSLVNEKMIRTRDYNYSPSKDVKYSPRDVVEVLYGKAPDRLKFPNIEIDALQEAKESDIKEIQEIEEFAEKMQDFGDKYLEAMDREGCTIPQE